MAHYHYRNRLVQLQVLEIQEANRWEGEMDTKALEQRAEVFRIACNELYQEKEQERIEKNQYKQNYFMLKSVSQAQTRHIRKLENELIIWRIRNKL